MIVIARPYGQLGNRLFLYAHFIAAAEEYQTSVANPSFAEYAHLFEATRSDLWCRYPAVAPSERSAGTDQPFTRRERETDPPRWQRKLLGKAVYLAARGGAMLPYFRHRTIRLRSGEACDLQSREFRQLLEAGPSLLAQGWRFRSESLLQKHASVVRDHLRILACHRHRVDAVVDELREGTDVVIGIHVRHGDYAAFMNGKYYYPIQDYARMMQEVDRQLQPLRVRFLVCGNGELNRRDFTGLDVQLGPGHIAEDLYAFARCDLLIGPPSTYTGWAAFYGDLPLIEWRDAREPIDALAVLPCPRAGEAA